MNGRAEVLMSQLGELSLTIIFVPKSLLWFIFLLTLKLSYVCCRSSLLLCRLQWSLIKKKFATKLSVEEKKYSRRNSTNFGRMLFFRLWLFFSLRKGSWLSCPEEIFLKKFDCCLGRLSINDIKAIWLLEDFYLASELAYLWNQSHPLYLLQSANPR